jgi:acyl-ACP thioesterase
MMEEEAFTRQYNVRYSETDFAGKLRPVSVLDYMQDAASGHSAKYRFSVRDLRQRNMTWVVSRYHILLLEYPTFGDSLCVRTWRSGIHGHFALREFEILDEQCKRVAVATSSWAIISLETKRPVKIDSVFPDFPTVPRRAVEDSFSSLPKLGNVHLEELYPVRMADLDLNDHVNNAVYMEWALETIPQDMLRTCRPAEIEISYRAEAFYGDTIAVRMEWPDVGEVNSLHHQLVSGRTGKELARLRTVWRRDP